MSSSPDQQWMTFADRYSRVLTNLIKLQVAIDPNSEPDEDRISYYVSRINNMKRQLEQAERNLRFVREALKKLKQEKAAKNKETELIEAKDFYLFDKQESASK